jgi:hypothetical protein
MGFFTRRVRFAEMPVAEMADQWLLTSGEIMTADGDQADDDGCASEQAYGVKFWLGGASLTIWAYVTYTATDDPADYAVGYRIEHETGDWDGALYDSEPGTFTDSLEDADAAAQGVARVLADLGEEGASEALVPYFDWDGTAW